MNAFEENAREKFIQLVKQQRNAEIKYPNAAIPKQLIDSSITKESFALDSDGVEEYGKVKFKSASLEDGLVGVYRATNGVKLYFESYFSDELSHVVYASSKKIKHNQKNSKNKLSTIFKLDPRHEKDIAEEHHSHMFFNGINIQKVFLDFINGNKDEDSIDKVKDFLYTPEGVAYLQLSEAIYLFTGNKAASLKPLIHPITVTRMMLEAITEVKIGSVATEFSLPDSLLSQDGMPIYSIQSGDSCQLHHSNHIIHGDGTFDDLSDDIGSTSHTNSGSISAFQENNYESLEITPFNDGDCFGCCGPGCWGCTGIYLPECSSHDSCVSNLGHLACLGGLWTAIRAVLVYIVGSSDCVY